jgi:hypothetical protein
MCLDHCERILSRYPGSISGGGTSADGLFGGVEGDDPLVQNPPFVSLPDTQTHNDIVDDMMSIAGTFGTMDGFPFDMTGIWDVSGLHDINIT